MRTWIALAVILATVTSSALAAKKVHVDVKKSGDVMGAINAAQLRTGTTVLKTTWGQLRLSPGRTTRFDLAGGHVQQPYSGLAVADGLAARIGLIEVSSKGKVLGTLDGGTAARHSVMQKLDAMATP